MNGFLLKFIYESFIRCAESFEKFGIYVYIGKRLYDIEVMKIELQRLYDNGLISRDDYLKAELILRREHRLELEKENKK